MSIWNKILIGVIFFTATAFAYLAARTLKTHQYWRNVGAVHQFCIEKEQYIQEVLEDGGEQLVIDDNAADKLRRFYREREISVQISSGMKWPEFKQAVLNATKRSGQIDMALLEACTPNDEKIKQMKIPGNNIPGNKRLRADREESTNERGRLWITDGLPALDDDPVKQIEVLIKGPRPHGIGAETTLYVFEPRTIENGEYFGGYLGAFHNVTFQSLDANNDQKLAKDELPAAFQDRLDEFDTEKNGAKDGILELDEFNTSSIAKEIQPLILEPVTSLSARQNDRLQKSSGPWLLYEKMPADRRDLFAGWSEDELKKALPEEVVKEYLWDKKKLTKKKMDELGLPGMVLLLDEDGDEVYVNGQGEELSIALVEIQDKDPEDDSKTITVEEAEFETVSSRDKTDVGDVAQREPPDDQAEGTYLRELRDYWVLFNRYERQRPLLEDRTKIYQRQVEFAEAGAEDAKQQTVYLEGIKGNLIAELDVIDKESKDLDGHRQKLEETLTRLEADVERVIVENKVAAAKIARIQADAIERIEERTRRMVRAGGGG